MYKSQFGQDKYLEDNIFKGFKSGTFVDVGAHDGISINNTLYFETMHNWKGINIEPNPTVYGKLVKNRPACMNLCCAVSELNGQEVEFLCNTGYTEMLSGIKTKFDPRHLYRIAKENKMHSASTETIKVMSRSLASIFEEHNVQHVHYLSIDVEGGEFDVIRSINFDKVYIDVIGFENNYIDCSKPIVKYLQDKGYLILAVATDIFMIHSKSSFIPKK